MRVWITKYALTRGVMVIEDADRMDSSTVRIDIGGGCREYCHGNDWHTTPEAAAARVKEMTKAKSRSLDNQRRKMGEIERLLGLGKLPGLEGVKC